MNSDNFSQDIYAHASEDVINAFNSTTELDLLKSKVMNTLQALSEAEAKILNALTVTQVQNQVQVSIGTITESVYGGKSLAGALATHELVQTLQQAMAKAHQLIIDIRKVVTERNYLYLVGADKENSKQLFKVELDTAEILNYAGVQVSLSNAGNIVFRLGLQTNELRKSIISNDNNAVMADSELFSFKNPLNESNDLVSTSSTVWSTVIKTVQDIAEQARQKKAEIEKGLGISNIAAKNRTQEQKQALNQTLNDLHINYIANMKESKGRIWEVYNQIESMLGNRSNKGKKLVVNDIIDLVNKVYGDFRNTYLGGDISRGNTDYEEKFVQQNSMLSITSLSNLRSTLSGILRILSTRKQPHNMKKALKKYFTNEKEFEKIRKGAREKAEAIIEKQFSNKT